MKTELMGFEGREAYLREEEEEELGEEGGGVEELTPQIGRNGENRQIGEGDRATVVRAATTQHAT